MHKLSIQEKINNCLLVIQNLYVLLKIIGTGLLTTVGLYGFIKEEFSLSIAKVIITAGFVFLIIIILTLARKYYIIVQLNTKE